MNNNDYIYNLVFKNKEGKDITSIPLSSSTEIDFQIPKDSLWIELKINRLTENKKYERYTLYNLITKEILENKFNKTKDGYYIVTSRFKYYPSFSEINLKTFNTNEELQDYITELIQFFHDNPYGQTNKEEITEPKEIKTNSSFSRKLTKILNQK